MLYKARDFITPYEAVVALYSSHTKEIGLQVSSDARPRRDCGGTLVRTGWMRHSGTGLLYRSRATCPTLSWSLLSWKFDFELLSVFVALM